MGMQQYDSKNRIGEATFGAFNADCLPDSLKERYRLEEKIGEGGMGIVYKAFDTILKESVSLKFLKNQENLEENAIRFQNEARAAGNLKHKNIATVLDFGIIDNSTLYMVSTYIDARELKAVIKESGPMPVAKAIAILLQIADCINHIHQKGILHRDVKPGNILVKENDQEKLEAYLLDFGIAESINSENGWSTNSAPGTIVGSPLYMSPEQASGQKIDERSDIYSLGVVAYELLTGHPPFQADTTINVIQKHRHNQPEPIDKHRPGQEIPEKLTELVEQMLQKDPADRIQSMALVYEKLQKIEEERTTAEKLASISERKDEVHSFPILQTFSKSRALTASATLFLIVVAGLATLSLITKRSTEVKLTELEHKPKSLSKNTEKIVVGLSQEIPTSTTFKVHTTRKTVGERELLTVKVTTGTIKERIDWSNLAKYKEDFYLYAEGAYMQEGDLEKILSYPHLKALNIAYSDIMNNEASMKTLAQRDDLLFLRFSRQPEISAKGLQYLADIKALKGLEINHCQIDAEKMRSLSKLSNLEQLKIRGDNSVDDQIYAQICKNFPKLKSLSVEECSIKGTTLGETSRLKRLEKLWLARTKVNDRGIAALTGGNKNNPKGLSNLLELDLTSTLITREGFKLLNKLPSLQFLMIGNCPNLNDYEIRSFSRAMKFTVQKTNKQESIESFLSF